MPAISRRAAALRPAPCRALQKAIEIAVRRVLEREAVEHVAVGLHERKRVVDADRARMAIEQLAEVRLAQPAVDLRLTLMQTVSGTTSDRPSRAAR